MIVHYSRLALIFLAAFGLTLSFAYDDILLLSMALVTTAKNVVANETAALAASQRPLAVQAKGLFQAVPQWAKIPSL